MTVVDPVCGKTFALELAAAHEDWEGWANFFCSAECHARFKQAPRRYAAQGKRPVADTVGRQGRQP